MLWKPQPPGTTPARACGRGLPVDGASCRGATLLLTEAWHAAFA
eukprot:COSAG06_NODE_56985_length_282_cov_0.846995_1_plen_43_part_10